MKYHAPTKQFTVSCDKLEYAAFCALDALKNIRRLDDLPMTKYERVGALSLADMAQKSILDAMTAIGIDLGAEWGNQLDLSGR